jgi:prepilin-type N-terminal cleavage/methylation domain-containing protein/prepilin-type processing-associated H-X9-DG protein
MNFVDTFGGDRQSGDDFTVRTHRNRLFQPRYGFTLIELLVVVAIIAVLVSILLPALAMARENGRKIACGSHMHQIGLVLNYYLGDSNGMLPTSDYANNPFWHDPKHPLASYFNIPQDLRNMPVGNAYVAAAGKWLMTSILKCPSETRPPYVAWADSPWPDYTSNGWFLPDLSFIYAYGAACGLKSGWNIDAVVHPASYVAFAEKPWHVNWSHHDGNAIYDVDPTTGLNRYVTCRHLGKTNLLFADGHVEVRTFSDLLGNVRMYYWDFEYTPPHMKK